MLGVRAVERKRRTPQEARSEAGSGLAPARECRDARFAGFPLGLAAAEGAVVGATDG